LSQKQAFSKKKDFAGFEVSFCPKNKRSLIKKKGIRRIRSVFCLKNGPGYKSQGGGAKFAQGGQNISRGAASPPAPYFPRLWTRMCVEGGQGWEKSIVIDILYFLLSKIPKTLLFWVVIEYVLFYFFSS